MTRRIALAILATVWATLIAGGLVAYLVTRAVQLRDLDQSIIRKSQARDEVRGRPEYRPAGHQPADAPIFSKDGADAGAPRHSPMDYSPEVLPIVRSAKFIKQGSGQRYRQLELEFRPPLGGGAPLTIWYPLPSDHFDDFMNRLAMSLGIFGAIAGLASAGLAIVVSRHALRPLRATADAIGEIDEQRLDRRIDADALPEELQPVADRLNQMLGRIDLAFAQRKQFLADASHELRTPVAALVTTIEVALRRPREIADYVRTLKVCLSDSRLLRQLIQTLLDHARSEAAPESVQTFDAIPMLNQCADVADGLAGGCDVKVVRILPMSLEVKTHPNRLRGIVMNLLGNAVEHNHPGGSVEIHCESHGTELEISVTDTGPGIAAEHLPQIFQPFYRAASREEPENARQHMGLGLFLVDSHIKALGGECRIRSEVGVGTTFHIRLPNCVVVEAKGLVANAV